MKSKFDDLYTRGWKPPAAGQPADATATPLAGQDAAGAVRRVPRELFQSLDAQIRKTLGARVAGLEPLLEEGRQLMVSLFPVDHPSEWQGAAREKGHQKLAAVLDQVEDLFQALQLASRSR